MIKLLPIFAFCFASTLHAQAAPAHADTIKYTPYQRQQLLDLKTQTDEITLQQSVIIRTIIASKRDPKILEGWTIQLTDSAVVVIPPKVDSTKVKKP